MKPAKKFVRYAGAVLALLAPLFLTSCTGKAGHTGRKRVASVASVSPAMLRGLRYRMIGPVQGGRVTAVAGVPGETDTFYMGPTGGGVWKTVDAGEVWQNISDKYFRTGAVGAIAVALSNPDVIYVGTGSADIRNNVQVGRGMYRSTDGGATWQSDGLEDAGQIAAIRIDPHDPNLVYVAALGHAFGPNSTRGVFRSRDGGRTWQKVLYINDRTGAADLSMNPRNPRILYATMWTAVRHPWGLISGSTEEGIFKTTDGGNHWTKLSGGLPKGTMGRIGVAVSPADPSLVWALVDAAHGAGVYRSDDAGKTFRRVNSNPKLTGRSWYYGCIWADPKDRNVVYVGNTNFYKSVDGGKTFLPIPMPHGDNHALWINPRNTAVMIEGNDGGATVSLDGGHSWSSQLNQPTAEIYRVAVDDQYPYRVYGAEQDQYNTISVSSRTVNFGERMQLQHWFAVGGMEGGFVAFNPHNPVIFYAGGPGGMITRFNRADQHLRQIDVDPAESGRNTASKSLKYRFTWNAPIFVSPLEPQYVYYGSQYVLRTSDGGQTWKAISPDLTRNDKRKEAYPGGVGSEAMPYPTISALAESPLKKGVIWAGSDDGLVHVSLDDGAHWENVTPKAMPAWATVNTIEPSPHNPARAFLAVFRYQIDDYHPYIFRTDNYGKNWTLLTDGRNGIPATDFVRVVREDPVREGLLYAGTEFGMCVSFDNGRHWQSLQLNLPVVPITDIAVHDSDLVLSTNGRSFWILDDITPLRRLAVESFPGPHLFTPRDTYRASTSAGENDQPYVGGACCVSNPRDIYYGARIERHRLGQEPPDGAILYASFPTPPSETVKLEILDAKGNLLRTIVDTGHPETGTTAPAVRAGLNRYVWNLRVEPELPGAPKPHPRGPKVVPGTYQVRLTVGSQSQTKPLRVLADPNLHEVTQADYQLQYDLLIKIGKAIGRARSAETAIDRELSHSSGAAAAQRTSELTALKDRLAVNASGAPPALLPALINLYGFVAGSRDKPTASANQRWEVLRKGLDDTISKVNTLVGQRAAGSSD